MISHDAPSSVPGYLSVPEHFLIAYCISAGSLFVQLAGTSKINNRTTGNGKQHQGDFSITQAAGVFVKPSGNHRVIDKMCPKNLKVIEAAVCGFATEIQVFFCHQHNRMAKQRPYKQRNMRLLLPCAYSIMLCTVLFAGCFLSTIPIFSSINKT